LCAFAILRVILPDTIARVCATGVSSITVHLLAFLLRDFFGYEEKKSPSFPSLKLVLLQGYECSVSPDIPLDEAQLWN